jgi:hypothetical protein
VDIERADFLRPIAEGLNDVGDRDDAMHAWALALDAGSLNPNAKPRAEDLTKTCLSMVRSGVEPTDAMREKIANIRAGLKAPW